jgi:hypothetical protein
MEWISDESWYASEMAEKEKANVIQLRAAKLARDTDAVSANVRQIVESIAILHRRQSPEWIEEKTSLIVEALLEMREAAEAPLALRLPATMNEADIQANQRELSKWAEKLYTQCGSALITRIVQLLNP